MTRYILLWFAIVVSLILTTRQDSASAYGVNQGPNERASAHFMWRELCKDQEPCVVDPELIERLEELRVYIGQPIIVTSGYRSPERNVEVGGAEKSLHITGKAVDIRVSGLSMDELAKAASDVGFSGIGIYDAHVHVDIGEERTWRGKSK